MTTYPVTELVLHKLDDSVEQQIHSFSNTKAAQQYLKGRFTQLVRFLQNKHETILRADQDQQQARIDTPTKQLILCLEQTPVITKY